MAKNTISMKRFRAGLTKISRLAKSGYNSITTVAKGIISTVTSIASRISVLSDKAEWQPPAQSFSASDSRDYYDMAAREEEAYLKRSINNLTSYKDAIIFDIFTVRDAASHNSEQVGEVMVNSIKSAFDGATLKFFASGKESGKSFGAGFEESVKLSVDNVIQNLKTSLYGMGRMNLTSTSGVSNITYSNPSYNFYSSGQTVSEQLSQARIADTINELRRA